MGVLIDEEHGLRRFRHSLCHDHRLGGGGRLVQEGGIGEIETGEVHHHLLEVQECFQPALADLRLIGRIGGVPARAFPEPGRKITLGMIVP